MSKKDFPFYSKPFSHQEKEFYSSRDKESYAILWEMGCGKTKVILDQAAWLSDKSEIDGLLVIAPNGVHRNWVVDQIPQHCDPSLNVSAFLWQSAQAGGKKYQKEFSDFLTHPELVVFAINYDALITKNGYAACEKFLKERVCMMVLDESHRIKSPGAKRTKNAIKLGRLAKYRRILSGTPVGNSPFDVFSQFGFLDPDILGYKSFFVFKNRFGVFEPQYAGTHKFNKLLRYRNLEELQGLIKNHSSRVTKDEVLDLPPKLYTKRYFQMTPEQQAVYDELRETYMVELRTGERLTAQLALVRLLRLQQVACGYLPFDGEMIRIDQGPNPRIKALLDTLEDFDDQKVIIFVRFVEDMKQIMDALPAGSAVQYSSQTGQEDICKFETDCGTKYFVANPQSASEGLNLQVASVVIYYSSTFKLLERLQGEDRIHRYGQTKNCTYVDMIATGTVDERIVEALREKKNLASIINGDNLKEWI